MYNIYVLEETGVALNQINLSVLVGCRQRALAKYQALFIAYSQHRLNGISAPGISDSAVDLAESIEFH
jgi:hypothetical protein